jgi:hypothetical protein
MLTVIAVFLPWYGLSFTSAAVDFVDGAVGQVVPQFAGSIYEAHMRQAGNAVVGHEFYAVSAHQIFDKGSTLLLIAGGLAILLSMVSLVRTGPALPVGGLLVGLGLAAAAVVAWHMVVVPNPVPELMDLSLKSGAWLGLLGSLAIAAGALWPASRSPRCARDDSADAWADLSGWTPSA